MNVAAFEEFLKEPSRITRGCRPDYHRPYQATDVFPTPRIRFDARCPDNPLDYWSFGSLCLSEGLGTSARKVESDETSAAGRAARRLPDAFVIVDGIVHAECPEPVWHCNHIRGRTAEIVLLHQPEAMPCANYFRLDQEARARAWATSRRWTIVNDRNLPRVDILSPTAVQRLDLVEIARTALGCWSYMRSWCKWARIEVYGLAGHAEMLDRARAEYDRLLWQDIGTVLDAISEIRRTFAAGMRCRDGSYHGRPNALDATVKRWAFERAGYDPNFLNQLDESDMDALLGIDLW